MSHGASLRQHRIERWCRLTLRVLAACFVGAGLNFLFFPDATVASLNAVGSWFGDFPAAPPSAQRFWLSLATGYMVLVTALAWIGQADLRRHRTLIAILALGKGWTASIGLIFYFSSSPAFIYLANFYVDGSITLMALAVWLAVPRLGPPPDHESVAPGGPRLDTPTFHAVLEAMVPSGGPFDTGARDVSVARDIETFVAGVGPSAVRWLRLGLRLFDFTPYFLPPFRMQRFSNLALEQRIEVLDAWEQSRWVPRRQAIHALKLLAMTQFYSRPDIEARLGYVNPLVRVPRTESAI